MALIHCNFYSESLKLASSMYVILPQKRGTVLSSSNPAEEKKYPVLYLLHGLTDDHTSFVRNSSIERYVQPLNLAVVMPAADRSYYTDMASGNSYWTFVSEELPEICRSFFPLSAKREDNFVAGISMGGYGAFKLAFTHPDRYAAAASFSGGLDMEDEIMRWGEKNRKDRERVFGDLSMLPGSKNDPFLLAEQLAASEKPRPALFQCCGTEDALYNGNVHFRDHARRLNLDLTYEEGPGIHGWDYWDKMIPEMLKWLPVKKKTGR